MSRNTYAKPTTTNASFMKVPVNLSSTTNATITWGALAEMLPLCVAGGTSPIKAIKLGAITVGGSPEAPAHLEFKGGQTFDLPALATKPMRVKASDKNLYVSGWRRIEVSETNEVSVLSNTDDDNVTESVVFTYRGQIAYIEVALRFYDDEGYRPWYTGDSLPSGPYTTYKMYRNRHTDSGKTYAVSWCYVLYFQESNTIVVGEEQYWDSEEQASEWLSAGTVVYGLVEGLYALILGASSSVLAPVGVGYADTPTTIDGTVMIGPLH